MAEFIELQCRCGKILRVPESRAGQTGKCVRCGEPVMIPDIEPDTFLSSDETVAVATPNTSVWSKPEDVVSQSTPKTKPPTKIIISQKKAPKKKIKDPLEDFYPKDPEPKTKRNLLPLWTFFLGIFLGAGVALVVYPKIFSKKQPFGSKKGKQTSLTTKQTPLKNKQTPLKNKQTSLKSKKVAKISKRKVNFSNSKKQKKSKRKIQNKRINLRYMGDWYKKLLRGVEALEKIGLKSLRLSSQGAIIKRQAVINQCVAIKRYPRDLQKTVKELKQRMDAGRSVTDWIRKRRREAITNTQREQANILENFLRTKNKFLLDIGDEYRSLFVAYKSLKKLVNEQKRVKEENLSNVLQPLRAIDRKFSKAHALFNSAVLNFAYQ